MTFSLKASLWFVYVPVQLNENPYNTVNDSPYQFIHLLFTGGHTSEGQKLFSPWLPPEWAVFTFMNYHGKWQQTCWQKKLYPLFIAAIFSVRLRSLLSNKLQMLLSEYWYFIFNRHSFGILRIQRLLLLLHLSHIWASAAIGWLGFSTLCFFDVHLWCATSKLALVRANLWFTFNWRETSTTTVILCYFTNMR